MDLGRDWWVRQGSEFTEEGSGDDDGDYDFEVTLARRAAQLSLVWNYSGFHECVCWGRAYDSDDSKKRMHA